MNQGAIASKKITASMDMKKIEEALHGSSLPSAQKEDS